MVAKWLLCSGLPLDTISSILHNLDADSQPEKDISENTEIESLEGKESPPVSEVLQPIKESNFDNNDLNEEMKLVKSIFILYIFFIEKYKYNGRIIY